MAGSFVNFVKNVERLGQKKRGRRPVFNAHQFYPSAIEADLERATREEFLRALEENIQLALRGFTDDIDDLTKAAAELPPEFVKKVSSLADAVGVKNGWNFSEYAKMTVGQPYFPPPAKDEIFEAWKKNFQQLCISAESDAKADISRIATEAKMKGWNKRELEAAIRAKLPAETKHRAELIARTETAKLNSAASISTYKQLGIRYYVWLTTLDGRDRETHTHLNGLICSLDNPNVYYEETPDGLVEKERTASMFHGNPGEDFQCRCSMVAWDPEIDGKYEVKERPEQEKGAEQRTEASTGENLHKVEQSVVEQEKQLQQLKNEQMQLLSRQRLEQAAEKRHARSVEEIADIQKRWDERKSRRRLKEAAEQRHSRRTSQEIAAIRKELQERLDTRQTAHRLLQDANGIKGLPEMGELEKALQKGGKQAYSDMKKLSRKLETSLDTLKGCTYLADPFQAARDFDYSTAITVNESVRKKLDGMGSSLAGKKHDLEFEIDWVEKHKKYASWKVAQDAYKKALAEVERLIDWETELGRVDSIKIFLKNHPKSAVLKKLTTEMDALIARGDNAAKTEIKELLKKAETRRKEIEYKEGLERLKKIKAGIKSGSSIPFSTSISIDDLRALKGDKLPPTLGHLDTAIEKYKKGHYYGSATKKHAAEIEATMRELFQKHDLGMHIEDDLLEKVFNSHFKNTFETGSSGGYSGPSLNADGSIKQSHLRLSAAHKLFDLGSTEKANQLNISQYEKYGNLLDHDKLREATTHNRATQYGNVAVRFKKDKVTCTWTAGDSLSERYQPSLVTDPKAVSYDDMYESKLPVKGTQTDNMTKFRSDNISSYLELQFHGDVTIDCVESLTFPYDLTEKAKSKYLGFAQKWKSIGTEVFYIKNGKLEKL